MTKTSDLVQEAAMTLTRAIGLDPDDISVENITLQDGVLCVDQFIRNDHGYAVDVSGSVKTRRRCFRITAEEITDD